MAWSEDCLYLNVWTPAKTGKERLPVLVYFYGGGFVAGDGSEPRYDGESMAKRGIVAVTVNYRLGVFGFMAHPELTKESPNKASGNYGLLDQSAALRWVKQNIAAFGGDPNKVTIAGESAGSFSVSAQMASPLSKNLIAGAIGESGSLLSLQPTATLAKAEQTGVTFATSLGANSLAALRALPAAAVTGGYRQTRHSPFSGGGRWLFLPESTCWNFCRRRTGPGAFTGGLELRRIGLPGYSGARTTHPGKLHQSFAKTVRRPGQPKCLNYTPALPKRKLYRQLPALAGDRFIGYSTWKWIDVHSQTSGKPVYRYMYSRVRAPKWRPKWAMPRRA